MYCWHGSIGQLKRLETLSLLQNKIDEQDYDFGDRAPLHIASHRGKMFYCYEERRQKLFYGNDHVSNESKFSFRARPVL